MTSMMMKNVLLVHMLSASSCFDVTDLLFWLNHMKDLDAMDIDALDTCKRVKRSFASDDLVEPSARKDDVVQEIDISSEDLGVRPWKHRGKFGRAVKGNSRNLIWQPKSSSFTSESLEKGYSIVAQKRVRNENGKSEVIVSPNEGNSLPFRRSDMRIKGKEVEGKDNHRQNFPVVGTSVSNRPIIWQPDEIANSSKKDKEVLSYRMKGNGIVCGSDMQGEVDRVMSKPSYLYSSGMNIGRAKAISKENVEKIVCIDLSDGVSSHELNSKHQHSKPDHFDKKKGKLNLEDGTPKDMQHGEPTIQSIRAGSLFGKEVVTNAGEQVSFESYQNLGWRNAQDFKINMLNQLSHTCPSNYKEKHSSSYLPEWRQDTDIEGKNHANVICESSQITTQYDISNPHHDQTFPNPVVSRRNHSWKKHVEGKKKCNSLPSNFEETSGSILNGLSYPQSHAETSNLKLDKRNKNKCHGTTLIEVDKLYPEARCCNSHGQQSGFSDNSSARASQIESDEIFARELQEQFYHETTRFIDMEKVDATIAWSLQQDEDANAAAPAWNGHSTSRDSSVAHLYSCNQPSSLFERLSGTTNHATTSSRNFDYVERCPDMVLFDEIRSNFDSEVDLETRLDLLEAMEDVLENSDMLAYDELASNHSFNDTDYEMQLDFDESNHHHVGSSEINNLPLSFIQNDNNKEACAVCLEIPSVGETMRHLPCLHKFHKMCIDTWLKRKPSCPVCKFKIT